MINTPGTALWFHDLESWCDAGHRLDARRASAQRYRQLEAHWRALPAEFVRFEPDPAVLEALLRMIGLPGTLAWSKPHRGWRGGSKWETVNMLARNRLWQLDRAADHAAMGMGHNSRAVAVGQGAHA